MDKKIGIIANDRKLRDTIIGMFKNEVEQGDIIVDILDLEKMEEQGKILESKGAKAIIARGGGYYNTVGRVSVPVIHLKITTLDILHAINMASKYEKDIVLIIAAHEQFDLDEWKIMISRSVIVERFQGDQVKEGIEKIIGKYVDKKDEIVILGGGIPCSYAQKLDIKFVHLGATEESIYEGVRYARELIDGLYEQKYKNEVLKTTLDGVHDAVIAVDIEGRIIIYNERAKELLKKDNKDVVDRNLLDVYPELDFMMEVMRNKINKYNEIINLKRIVIAANISILNIDGHIHGVLCSFQDITKLQNIEKKIRYELNKKGLVAKYSFRDIIANDPVMKDAIAKAVKIGLTDNTVMIYGESGTGKEMIAQSIHRISRKNEEPFVAINCAAISENLLESELFGYEEGAFTGARKGGKPGMFELAHGGTIFLDEINSISLNLQAKLLRVLEEREIMRIGSDYVIPLDVRIIAAANEELMEKVREGKFRSDLFYRLNILKLRIPPLRERKKDIIPLFKYFLENASQGHINIELNSETEKKVINHSWPGNVRELKNVAQRYALFEEIDLDEYKTMKSEKNYTNEVDLSLREIYQSIEENMIDMMVSKGMSQAEIAKQIGISTTALWKKKKK